MYGFVGQRAGFSIDVLTTVIHELKTEYNQTSYIPGPDATIDAYDDAAYLAGYVLASAWTGGDSVGFCELFRAVVSAIPESLREQTATSAGGNPQYNDLGSCKPCRIQSGEHRHGGSERPTNNPTCNQTLDDVLRYIDW